jgi:hypothetical protein
MMQHTTLLMLASPLAEWSEWSLPLSADGVSASGLQSGTFAAILLLLLLLLVTASRRHIAHLLHAVVAAALAGMCPGVVGRKFCCVALAEAVTWQHHLHKLCIVNQPIAILVSLHNSNSSSSRRKMTVDKQVAPAVAGRERKTQEGSAINGGSELEAMTARMHTPNQCNCTLVAG